MNDRSKTKHDLIQESVSLDDALKYAGSIIDTIREPLIALDQDLRIVSASRSLDMVLSGGQIFDESY